MAARMRLPSLSTSSTGTAVYSSVYTVPAGAVISSNRSPVRISTMPPSWELPSAMTMAAVATFLGSRPVSSTTKLLSAAPMESRASRVMPLPCTFSSSVKSAMVSMLSLAVTSGASPVRMEPELLMMATLPRSLFTVPTVTSLSFSSASARPLSALSPVT